MQPETPTLTHVARLANVSENTVSRVIRNKGSIAEDTRKRVLDAIDTLGYVPNRAAGSLASSASLIIGVILPSLSNIVFPEVLRGIHAGLADTPYQPMIGVTDYDLGKEQQLVSSLLAWQPTALITTGFEHTDAARRTRPGPAGAAGLYPGGTRGAGAGPDRGGGRTGPQARAQQHVQPP